MAYRRDAKTTYRAVLTRLFDDPDYQRLTPRARLVLLTARLCDTAGPAAIFRYYPAILAAHTGLTLEQLEAALAELVAGDWVRRDAHVLWIRNGLRFDPGVSLGNRNHRMAVQRVVDNLPQTRLVATFRKYYKLEGHCHSPSKAIRMASVIPEPEPEPDNFLKVSYPHSTTPSPPDPAAPGPDRQARLEAFRRYQAAYRVARDQVDLEHPELSNAQREALAQDRVRALFSAAPPPDKET